MKKTLIIAGAVLAAVAITALIIWDSKNVKPVERPAEVFTTEANGWSMLGGYGLDGKLKNLGHYMIKVDPKVPLSEIKVGDVIIYRHRHWGKNIVHEVIERRGAVVKCRGTGNVSDDGVWVEDLDYIGKVIAVGDIGSDIMYPVVNKK